MCRKVLVLFCAVMLLAVASNALAGGGIWLGFGTTDSWDDGANWQNGVPLAGDTAIVRFSETSVTHEPVIGAGVAATSGALLFGDFNNSQPADGPVTLGMTGGTLDGTGDFQLAISGGSANFDLSGGTATVPTLLLGHAGGSAQATTGTVNQSGGTFNIGTAFIDFNSGGPNDVGNYNLHGGRLAVTVLGMGPEGLLDIAGGTMTLAGDQLGLVGFLAGIGQITAFGGAGTVVMDFDVTNTGLTTVTAIPEPTSAMLFGAGGVLLCAVRRRRR